VCGVKHGVIGAIGRALGIAVLKQLCRGGYRAFGAGQQIAPLHNALPSLAMARARCGLAAERGRCRADAEIGQGCT
jgi:hypothetical protein